MLYSQLAGVLHDTWPIGSFPNILVEKCQFHQQARNCKQAASSSGGPTNPGLNHFSDFLDISSTNILVQDG
jgi:hypothetical protein